jgi:transcriptional regulator NrdR family protein
MAGLVRRRRRCKFCRNKVSTAEVVIPKFSMRSPLIVSVLDRQVLANKLRSAFEASLKKEILSTEATE